MGREEAPNHCFGPCGVHDRKVKLRDPRPVYQKPLPRDLFRVKHFNYFGSHRGIDHAGRPVLLKSATSYRNPSFNGGGEGFAMPKNNRPLYLRAIKNPPRAVWHGRVF
jgi:hypothetical protein